MARPGPCGGAAAGEAPSALSSRHAGGRGSRTRGLWGLGLVLGAESDGTALTLTWPQSLQCWRASQSLTSRPGPPFSHEHRLRAWRTLGTRGIACDLRSGRGSRQAL